MAIILFFQHSTGLRVTDYEETL